MRFRLPGMVVLATVALGCSDGGSDSLELEVPAISGLDSRPVNASCIAPARDAVTATIETPRAFPNLTFASPVALERAPGDASRWFVVEQRGRIRIFDAVESASVAQDFVDLTGRVHVEGESGLLGLAFHPNFATNGRAFVTYVGSAGGLLRFVASEFTSPDGGLTLDPNSERVLLALDKDSPRHNGGFIGFGPDGRLYVGFGDDGKEDLRGGILRIDVDARSGNPQPEMRAEGFSDPRHGSFDRRTGRLRVGGRTYRGTRAPALVGHAVIGSRDGTIAVARADGGRGSKPVPVVRAGAAPRGAPGPLQISAIGEGADGELYLLDYGRGEIRRLVFADAHSGDNVPHRLSDTGCVATSAPAAPPLLSLIPFKPNAALWSDGAVKDRWFGLPDGEDIAVQPDGDWDLPEGTVIVKHFRLGDRLVETRLFMRHPDGAWAGYTYQWNDEQTEAMRVSDGLTVPVGSQDYIFPSEADCLWCHNAAAGFTLGPETAQLNGRLLYPQTGRSANQLTTLNAIDVLSPPVGADPPAYADHADAGASLESRARAYLHINCSICHRPGGPTPAGIDLRHDTPLAATNACDVAPTIDDLGIPDARIIAPGDPERSELLSRMSRRDFAGMPPVASRLPDEAGVSLVRDWIASLAAADCR